MDRPITLDEWNAFTEALHVADPHGMLGDGKKRRSYAAHFRHYCTVNGCTIPPDVAAAIGDFEAFVA